MAEILNDERKLSSLSLSLLLPFYFTFVSLHPLLVSGCFSVSELFHFFLSPFFSVKQSSDALGTVTLRSSIHLREILSRATVLLSDGEVPLLVVSNLSSLGVLPCFGTSR